MPLPWLAARLPTTRARRLGGGGVAGAGVGERTDTPSRSQLRRCSPRRRCPRELPQFLHALPRTDQLRARRRPVPPPCRPLRTCLTTTTTTTCRPRGRPPSQASTVSGLRAGRATAALPSSQPPQSRATRIGGPPQVAVSLTPPHTHTHLTPGPLLGRDWLVPWPHERLWANERKAGWQARGGRRGEGTPELAGGGCNFPNPGSSGALDYNPHNALASAWEWGGGRRAID